MSTDSNQQIDLVTKFESMSNELLMEIFQYYDLYSLFFSFGSLNSRIDNILSHCQVFVDLDRVQPLDFVDFLAHTLCRINSKNIRSLHASKSHQIEVLAYDKSLIYFTYIRSLSLNNSRSSIIENMVSRLHFAYLERVSIINCDVSYTWSCFQHFLDTNRYHYLRIYRDFDSIPNNVTSMLPLERLSMGKCILRSLLNILQQSPYLKYIRTRLYLNNQYSELRFVSTTPQYYALTRLNLSLCRQFCMNTLDYLFKCLPRLSFLKLHANVAYQIEYIEPIFWETFLRKHFVELKRLHLFACMHDENSPPNPVWNHLTNIEPFLEQIEKSDYWSSHQWKAEFICRLPTSSTDDYRAGFTVD